MATHISSQQPELLTSWKEIAAYLGKGVRTVQRWELEFGLPVRRPNEKVKGIVHASREDLDKWLNMQWSQRPPKNGNGHADVTLNGLYISAVRAGIRQSAELRSANRRLLAEVRQTLHSFVDQCQSLAMRTPRNPPGDS
ncbi:MAG TPA: hypothetical protein VL240_00790 [Candidatus Binatia bacterium]|nr:hypothetical protein [Candidatus Binatia bacterium]